MDESRRRFLKAVAVSSPLAGCIEVENEEEHKDKHRRKTRAYDGPDIVIVDEDDSEVTELEPSEDETSIDETLEETTTEDSGPRESQMCEEGFLETAISISSGETVRFEEPLNIEGGDHTSEGYLTNEGDKVRIEYSPSVLYLEEEGQAAHFSFEEGPYGDIDYGDYNKRVFGLHEYDSDEAVIETYLVKDQWGPNRREAIGVCLD